MKSSGRLALLTALLCAAAAGCRKPEAKPQEAPKAQTAVEAPKVVTPNPNQDAAEAAKRAEAEHAAFRKASEAALKDIHFDYDQADVRTEDREALQRLAAFLRAYPTTKIEIEGHCDERGTNEYNIALGNRRASTTLHYLTALGIRDERFTTISYGKEKPLCTQGTESCWSQNRRAHFLLTQ